MGGTQARGIPHRLAVPVRRGLREDAAEDAGDADEDEGAEVYSLVGCQILTSGIAVLRDSLIKSPRAALGFLPERLGGPPSSTQGRKCSESIRYA